MTVPSLDETLRNSCSWVSFQPEVAGALNQAIRELTDAERADLVRMQAQWTDDFQPVAEPGRPPLFYALFYLSLVPHVREKLRPRHIPEDVIRETVRDLEVWMADYRQRFGFWGLDNILWPRMTFAGRLFALGRLQFEPTTLPATCLLPEGLGADSPILNIHIPATGPLDDVACGESLRRALAFFPEHFPEFHPVAFYCESWIMDRQFSTLLPDSNIAKFQNRFQSLERKTSCDRQMWERVFGGRMDPADAPRDTALQRIVLDHIASGGRWSLGAGYLPLAST